MSASYYMTTMHPSTIGHWMPCSATTLAMAKREATRELGGGHLDHTLCVGKIVATDEHGNGLIETVSSRLIRDNRWS